MSLLNVKSVSFSYPGTETSALRDVSFSIEKGGYTAVIGANGSGKSTLARLICGFLPVQSGAILTEREILTGIVFQSPKEQVVCSIVKRDTAFGPQNLDVGTDEIELRTIECLSVTGLLDRIDSKTMALSLGQTQKLAFSGILALHPDLLVLDEVTAMLDPASRSELLSIVDEWNKSGHTILHITHSREEALRAKTVIALDRGTVIFDGTSRDFAANTNLVGRLFGHPLEAIDRTSHLTGDCSFYAEAVNFSYGGRKVLSDITFSLEKGTLTALTGPSGVGKSTLLEVCSGLLDPDGGKILGISRPVLSRQDSVSALFERFAADDVAFGPRNLGITGPDLVARVKKAMDMVSLPFDEFANRQTFLLSGGEQRKLSIAGIIAMDSPIMFFDEPTAGLDPAGRRIVMYTLRELSRSGKTVVFSTHRMDEAVFSDRELTMRDGKIVSDTEDLRSLGGEKKSISGVAKLLRLLPLEGVGLLSSLRSVSERLSAADNHETGIVGRLPPLVKYILFFTLFFLSLSFRSILGCICMLVVAFGYAAVAKFSAKRLAVSLLKVLPWLLFFCVFQIVFFPSQAGERVFIPVKYFTVTPSKLLLCARTFLHTGAAFACISAFVYSTPEYEIIEGFSSLLKPLALCHIPTRPAVAVVEIVFRFLPLLTDEAGSIIKTQLVRGGLGRKKGVWAKIRGLVPLIVPLMIQTIKRSEILADALTARYFK